MKQQPLYVEGELYLSLETVAEVYQVKVVWLQEVYDIGLLGVGVGSTSGICVAAVQLDRIATVVRMHRVLGLNVEAIALTLGD